MHNQDERDLRYIWHPFTTTDAFREIRLLASEADGLYLVGPDGRRYLDAISGMWFSNFGYSDPRIIRAIERQLHKLPAHSLIVGSSTVAADFAEQLLATIGRPDIGRVFFANGGSEGVETAIKLARHYFFIQGRANKRVILSMRDSYHGMSYGALSATGISEDRITFGSLVPEIYQIGSPKLFIEPSGTSRLIEMLHDNIRYYGADNIAAVLIEPIYTVAGVVPCAGEFLSSLAQLCELHDILLIADEVTTGMGRSGTFLASEQMGIRPDMIVMGKALSNGYVPFGAVAVSNSIYSECESRPRGVFMHGYSFGGNPLACAAGIEALAILSSDYLGGPIAALADQFSQSMAEQLRDNRFIAAMRTVGLLGAVDLKMPDVPADKVGKYAREIRRVALERGVIVRPTYGGKTFNFLPMFICKREHFDTIFSVFSSAVESVLSGS